MTTRVRFSSETSDDRRRRADRQGVAGTRRPSGCTGSELYERTLLCITAERLNELAIRQLRLRHPNQFPRIEAVLLDAATADEALDLMTTATFTRPSKYWCQHHDPDDGFVFNRKMLVTGVRHRIDPDPVDVPAGVGSVVACSHEVGGRWGRGPLGSRRVGKDPMRRH